MWHKSLLLGLLALPIFAAGTCTTGMPIQTGTSTQYTLTVVCTADASTGSYPATPIPGLVAYPAMQGAFLISVQIQPGSPAPTAGYALTLKNAGNADQIGGQAHSLSASASVIYATTATSVPISGTLTVRFTGNSVNSAVTTLTLNISTVAGGSGGGGGSGITGTGTTGTPVSWTGSSTVGDAGFADVVGLWTTCSSGYLKFDGSCSTPTGGISALTGDVTASGTGSVAATLATVNSGSGACGDATHVCAVTTNAKGLVTAQTATAITSGVTSVATTSPITGGTITATGTIACATCVAASSPGVGLAHFAGSTQTVTSSAVNLAGADVTGTLANANLPGTGSTTVNGTTCTLGSTCTIGTGTTSSNGWGMWQLTVPSTLTNWVNQGSAAVKTGTNFVAIAAPTASAYSLRVRNAACPANFTNGSLDLYALVLTSGPTSSGVTTGGVEFDDGTKFFTFGITWNGSSSTMNSASFTTSSGGSGANVASDSINAAPGYPVWIWVHQASSTTLTYAYSFDGIGTPGTNGGWRTLGTGSATTLSAITNCGYFANSQTNTFTASTTLLSYAFVASLTAQ